MIAIIICTTVKVTTPDSKTEEFEITAGVLQEDMLEPYPIHHYARLYT